jgi:hypothetical protein
LASRPTQLADHTVTGYRLASFEWLASLGFGAVGSFSKTEMDIEFKSLHIFCVSLSQRLHK